MAGVPGDAADAATDLGRELSRLGIAAVKGLSDHNLDDLDVATALRVHLDEHDALVLTLIRALALVESVHSAARAGVDTPNVVWNVLRDHAVDPRVLSAFVYHVTTVRTMRRLPLRSRPSASSVGSNTAPMRRRPAPCACR